MIQPSVKSTKSNLDTIWNGGWGLGGTVEKKISKNRISHENIPVWLFTGRETLQSNVWIIEQILINVW